MANIADFKAQMTSGGARPNQFRVFINFPAGLGDIATAQSLQFLCKATSLPSSTIGSADVDFRGRKVHFAGERTFEPWNVTVYCDNDFKVRNAFERWSFAIQSTDATDGTQTPDRYQVDMRVQHLDRMDRVVKEYTFHDAWPSNIGAIQLDWGSNDTIETFECTFQHNYWTSPGIESPPLDA